MESHDAEFSDHGRTAKTPKKCAVCGTTEKVKYHPKSDRYLCLDDALKVAGLR